MYFKVANPRDFGLDEVEEEETAEQTMAPPASDIMSRYHQDQELSAMVAALSRVIAGEPAGPVIIGSSSTMPSPPSPLSYAYSSGHLSQSSSSSQQKRGRHQEALQLQYHQGVVEHGGYDSYRAGGQASSTVVSGEFVTLCHKLQFLPFF